MKLTKYQAEALQDIVRDFDEKVARWGRQGRNPADMYRSVQPECTAKAVLKLAELGLIEITSRYNESSGFGRVARIKEGEQWGDYYSRVDAYKRNHPKWTYLVRPTDAGRALVEEARGK